jgi:tripartite-type tricarboxylate transporter receptor subunit TctC
MVMHRFIRPLTGALCAAALATATAAEKPAGIGNYPERPVRAIVPVAAGGGTDIIARLVLTPLADRIGRPVVVDNRPGAGGLIGTELVARAEPDGHTLLFTYAAHTIVPFIYSKVPYNVYKDFAPIVLAGQQPLLLTINAKVPAQTTEELIKLARAKPNYLNVAWATPSSSGALAAELFKILTNTEMVSVPFKGGAPALTALVQNEVQVIFTTPPTVMPHLKAGRVRVLGTSGKERVPYLPDVPTLAEAGIKDFETAPWQGLLAPAATSPAIINFLYEHVAAILKMPEVRERFAAQGTDPVGLTPKEFGRMIDRELAQNSKVIKAVGMKAD